MMRWILAQAVQTLDAARAPGSRVAGSHVR